jgi:plasmid stabilization system protein ParE
VSFRVVFEVPAVRDAEEAFQWYEARRSGLGAEFAGAIALAAETLGRDPVQFPVTHPPFRWIKLRKFPYALHYRVKGNNVAVVACLHFRQSPDRWPGA